MWFERIFPSQCLCVFLFSEAHIHSRNVEERWSNGHQRSLNSARSRANAPTRASVPSKALARQRITIIAMFNSARTIARVGQRLSVSAMFNSAQSTAHLHVDFFPQHAQAFVRKRSLTAHIQQRTINTINVNTKQRGYGSARSPAQCSH